MESSIDVQRADEPYSLTCPNCSRVYTDRSRKYYEMHIRLCQQEKPYKCTVCGSGYSNRNTLKRHEKVHSGETSETCPECGKVVSTKFILKQHMAIHESAETRDKLRFKCSQCEKSFLFKSSLNKHYKTHTDDDVYRCDGCSAAFCSYSKKYHHSRNCHKYIPMKKDEGETYIDSPDCVSKREVKSANKRQHMTSDEPSHSQSKTDYPCDLCGQLLSCKSKLRMHRKTHSSTTGEECPICRKVLSTKFVLKQHMATHDPAEKRESTRFKCFKCEMSFLFQQSLRRHEKTHTETVYTCTDCMETFDRYHSIYKHYKQCEKHISKQNNKTNKGSHGFVKRKKDNCHGQKTKPDKFETLTNNHSLYKCQICEKSFTVREMLSKHVYSMHNDPAHQVKQCIDPVDDDATFHSSQIKESTNDTAILHGCGVKNARLQPALRAKQPEAEERDSTSNLNVDNTDEKQTNLHIVNNAVDCTIKCRKIEQRTKVKVKTGKDKIKCFRKCNEKEKATADDITSGDLKFECRKSKRIIKVKTERDFYYDQSYKKEKEKVKEKDNISITESLDTVINEEHLPETETHISMPTVNRQNRTDISEIKNVRKRGRNRKDLHINVTNISKQKHTVNICAKENKNDCTENECSPYVNDSMQLNSDTPEPSNVGNNSMSTHNMILGVACPYCKYRCSTIDGINDHKRVSHKGAAASDNVLDGSEGCKSQLFYPCSKCLEVFSNPEDLVKHKTEVHRDCPETSATSILSKDLHKQLAETGSTTETLKSSICKTIHNGEIKEQSSSVLPKLKSKIKTSKAVKKQKITTYSADISDADNTDVSVMYRCITPTCNCTTLFKWKKTLERHKQREHDEKLLHVCLICDSRYAETHVFKSHIRLDHSERPYLQLMLFNTQIVNKETMCENIAEDFHIDVCTACGVTFASNKPDSYQHDCVPKDISYCCPFCKHIGLDFSKVKVHIVEWHPELLQACSTNHNKGQYQNLMYNHVIPDEGGHESQADTEIAADANVPGESMTNTCITCARTFSTSRELQSHAKAHTGIRPFACGLCGYSYTRRAALRTHMLHHRGNGLKCWLCPKRYTNQTLLDTHEQTHSTAHEFQCDICGNSYCDGKSLKIHAKLKHKTFQNKDTHGSGSQCDLCGVILQTGKLQRHLRQKHSTAGASNRMACKYCPEKFPTQRDLQRHQRLLHSDHKLMYGTCMERTSGKSEYNSYVIRDSNSSSRESFLCSLCGRKFRRISDIHSHLRRVHRSETDKEHFCTICQRGFSRAQEVQVHMRMHTNSRPYVCRLCGKTYKQIGHVRQHMLSHSNRCSTCHICQKQFKTDVSLFTHVKNHCGIRPYKCPICAKDFIDLTQLLAHCAQYSDDDCSKIYTCHMCRQTFTSVAVACKHLLNHKADKPFACDKCSQSFSQYVQLYKHKVNAEHFSAGEIKTSARTRQQALTSCISVDMEIDELIKQYDYEPADNVEYDIDTIRGQKPEKKSKLPRKRKAVCPLPRKVVTDGQTYELVVEEQSTSNNVLITVTEQLTDIAGLEQPGAAVALPDYTSHADMGTQFDETTIEMESQEIQVEQCSLWDTEVVTSAGELECREYSDSLQPSSSYEHQGNTPNQFVQLNETNATPEIYMIEQECTEPIDYTASNGEGNAAHPDHMEASSSVLQPTMVDDSENDVFVCIVTDDNTPANDIAVHVDDETISNILQNEDFVTMQNLIETDAHSEETRRIMVVPKSATNPTPMEPDSVTLNKSIENVIITVQILQDEQPNGKNNATTVDTNNPDIKFDNNVDQECMNYKIDKRYYNRDQSEQARPFKCPDCPKRFKRQTDLHLHSSCHLPDASCRHKCRFCGKGFPVPSRVRMHENIHLGLKPFKCSHCPKSFRQQGHLMAHLRIHANYRPFQCSMCSKSYTTQAHLNQHVQRHKLVGERGEHKCRVCHKVYIEKRSLSRHLLTAHRVTSELNQEMADMDEISIREEKCKENLGSRMCDVCGKSYNTTTGFQNHLLIHSDKTDASQSVKCSRCAKLFPNRELLVQHMVCHEKSRYKFQCEICGQSISTKQGVDRHIQRCHANKA